MTDTIQRNSHKVISWFSTETKRQAEREQHDIFKAMKGKNIQPRILYPARLSFRFLSRQAKVRESAPPYQFYKKC